MSDLPESSECDARGRTAADRRTEYAERKKARQAAKAKDVVKACEAARKRKKRQTASQKELSGDAVRKSREQQQAPEDASKLEAARKRKEWQQAPKDTRKKRAERKCNQRKATASEDKRKTEAERKSNERKATASEDKRKTEAERKSNERKAVASEDKRKTEAERKSNERKATASEDKRKAEAERKRWEREMSSEDASNLFAQHKPSSDIWIQQDEVQSDHGDNGDNGEQVETCEDVEWRFWHKSGIDKSAAVEGTLSSETFDSQKALEAYANTTFDSVIRGCAACGTIFIDDGDAKREELTTFRLDVVEVFAVEEGSPLPKNSERGVATRVNDKWYTLRLIQDLVGSKYKCGDEALKEGHFFLCDQCTNHYNHKSQSALWPIDLGQASALPHLTQVEKAAIAAARVYGTVIKIKEKVACTNQPLLLKGHMICFPHDAVEKVSKVIFPRDDVEAAVQIHFVGSRTGWEKMLPLIRSGRGVADVRPDVLRVWLSFLKETSSFYHDITVDLSDERMQRLAEARDRILENAAITETDLVIGLDAAIGDAKVDEVCGMPSVVVERQEKLRTMQTAAKELKKTVLAKETGEAINEFDNNIELLSKCFPWVFATGSLPGAGKIHPVVRRCLLLRYDHRVEQEPTLLFLLFNQMQRHSFSHNIAHADQSVATRLNQMASSSSFEDDVRKMADENPSPDVLRFRNYLLRAVSLGQGQTSFSQGESDSFYVKMLAEIRFRGPPSVWLTLSPSAIENSFCLRLCFGGSYTGEEEYAVRSAKVLESPAMSALFLKRSQTR